MANELDIPRQHLELLGRLASLPPEEFDGLLKVLGAVQYDGRREEMVAQLGSIIPSLGAEVVDTLLTTLVATETTRSRYGWKADRAARNVWRAWLQEEIDGDVRPEQFKDRLTRILSIPSLLRAGKAIDLLVEQPALLHDARIITDLRPVFDDEVDEFPFGALLVHTLRIDYHDGEGVKSAYYAMDTGDVRELKRVIERAERKAETLQNVLDKASLPLLGGGAADE